MSETGLASKGSLYPSQLLEVLLEKVAAWLALFHSHSQADAAWTSLGVGQVLNCSWSLVVQFSSVTQFRPTLCDHMDWTTPGFPVLSPTSGACSNSCPSSQWCHPTISSCLQSFPASGSFLMSWLFTSSGQSIGVSASASVLPMNIQDWFPLGWTGLIFLLSKELSRFSQTTIQKHQFFALSLLYGPALISVHDYWKNHSVD